MATLIANAPLVSIEAVPLVRDDDQRPTSLDREPHQADVLISHALAGVEHRDDHLRALHRL